MLHLNLLYYKNILDIAFVKFVENNSNEFVKDGDTYVLARNMSKASLRKMFTGYIRDVITSYIKPFDINLIEYNFIIGACFPKDNILLEMAHDNTTLQRVERYTQKNNSLKYVLKEKDIIVDIQMLNDIFISIFNDLFSNRKHVTKMFGEKYCNLFFIQHRNLDCYSMFKIIRQLYGKGNCLNIHKEMMTDIRHPIVAINEIIAKNVHNKRELLKSDAFNLVKREIKQHVDECMASVLCGK